MKLPGKMDRILVAIAVLALIFVGIFAIGESRHKTFADTEDSASTALGDYFVTFYDEGKRLTVKTDAETVGEAIERAGIVLNKTDIVEPKLDDKINSDTFFINI